MPNPNGRWKNTEEWKKDGSPRINPKKAKTFNREYVEIAEKAVAAGATIADLAYLFGTSKHQINQWKRENPDFKRAVNRGRQLTQAYLIGKGIKAAGGYEYTDQTIERRCKLNENGELEEIPDGTVIVKEMKKHVPPDSKLLIFMVSALDRQLGNEDWQAKNVIESKVDITNTHKLDAGALSEQIDRLSGKLTKYVESHEVNPILEAEVVERNPVQEAKQDD
jgi:hypothetical protein